MKNIYIEELDRHAGEEVTIRGWVYNKRAGGKIRFLIVRDGTGLLQCVIVKSTVPAEVFEAFDALSQESSLEVTGLLRRDYRAPGGFEMEVRALKVVSIAREYPITPKEHGVDFLMDHRHLWLRSARQHAILR